MSQNKNLVLILVFLTAAFLAFAEVPYVVNYQGKLIDSDGKPEEDAVDMGFSFWTNSTAGDSIWGQAFTGVDPVHGIFSVELDISSGWVTTHGVNDFDAGDVWIQVIVEGDPLSPRERLTSAFHAFNVADGSVTQTKLKSAGTGTSNHLLSSDGAGGFNWADPDDVGTDSQDLSFTGTASPYTLEISGGDNVTLTAGTGITLSRTSGTNLTITNAGDNDNSSTNELITAASYTHASNTLRITEDGTNWDVDLSALDNAGSDIQNLTALATTGGVTIDLSGTDSDILVSGTGATTVSRTGTNEITISSTDDNTEYTAGNGITLTGTAFSADFAGTGTANTVARSDHDHAGVYDNYASWNLQANTGTAVGITSGSNVNFTGTGGAVVSRDGNTIQIDASGVSAPPGGSNTHVQYNDGSGFAGSANLTWDDANEILTIGTTNPITINGETGKIDVKTVDPVVEIDGEKYATYGWDGIGVRTDVVGVGELVNGEFRVDLATQKKASDLWLFYNVVAETTIVPFVTPQDPVILMARMEGSELLVRSISGEENARFSFRLSGKRIDMVDTEEAINLRTDNPHSHIKVEEYDKNGAKLK